MTVKVEACWGGGDNFYFRLTLPNGTREFVSGDTWNRSKASAARDLLENVYHIPRRNVRFAIH